MAKTTFIAAGDAFVTRRLPKGGYEGFPEMKALIEEHDVAFLNLESTFHEREGVPCAVSGGTWAMSDPRTLDDMAQVPPLSAAGLHSLSWNVDSRFRNFTSCCSIKAFNA